MITIYGASDDLVEVRGCAGADEFGAYASGAHSVNWRADLIAPDDSKMRVHAIYDGCWHLSVGQVDGDIPMALWPLSFVQGGQLAEDKECQDAPDYSVVLRIDAPEGTRLRNVWPLRDA